MNDPIIILSIVGILLVMMIVLIVLKHKINKTLSKRESQRLEHASKIGAVATVETREEQVIEAPKEQVVETPKEVAPKEQVVETKKEAILVSEVTAEIKEPLVEEVEEDDEDDEPAKETGKLASIYHISQNKDDKSARYKEWRVRKQGSQKTIKYFLTQKEAIAFAESLANKNDGKIIIHKKTGEIRKQNYNK